MLAITELLSAQRKASTPMVGCSVSLRTPATNGPRPRPIILSTKNRMMDKAVMFDSIFDQKKVWKLCDIK